MTWTCFDSCLQPIRPFLGRLVVFVEMYSSTYNSGQESMLNFSVTGTIFVMCLHDVSIHNLSQSCMNDVIDK